MGLATCLGCGCTCDDIEVAVDGGRIVEARHACALGAAWFGDGRTPGRSRVAGHDVSNDVALDTAAGLLRQAARPLIYLAPEISCAAQREGVALADRLRAPIDSVTTAAARRWVLAAQERGRAVATLGEIRNRADVMLFWGVDPARRYPRYPTRYAPDPIGLHLPEGRQSRTLIAVDIGDSLAPADADVRLRLDVDQEVDILSVLRAFATAGEYPPPTPASREPTAAGGQPWPPTIEQQAGTLIAALSTARYLAIVAEAVPEHDLDEGRVDALLALAQAMNARARCALSLLQAGGNRAGADAVLTWQTGFPLAVDFGRGYPRYRPHDSDASSLLEHDEADLVLLIGASDAVPAGVIGRLDASRSIIVGPRATEGALGRAACAIDTAVAGIHEAGLAIRMDEVPVPLRAILPGPSSAAALVRELRDRL